MKSIRKSMKTMEINGNNGNQWQQKKFRAISLESGVKMKSLGQVSLESGVKIWKFKAIWLESGVEVKKFRAISLESGVKESKDLKPYFFVYHLN